MDRKMAEHKARFHYMGSRLQLAADVLRSWIKNNGPDAGFYGDLGVIYFELEDFLLSEKYLIKAVMQNPDNEEAWKNLHILEQVFPPLQGKVDQLRESIETYKEDLQVAIQESIKAEQARKLG